MRTWVQKEVFVERIIVTNKLYYGQKIKWARFYWQQQSLEKHSVIQNIYNRIICRILYDLFRLL